MAYPGDVLKKSECWATKCEGGGAEGPWEGGNSSVITHQGLPLVISFNLITSWERQGFYSFTKGVNRA